MRSWSFPLKPPAEEGWRSFLTCKNKQAFLVSSSSTHRTWPCGVQLLAPHATVRLLHHCHQVPQKMSSQEGDPNPTICSLEGASPHLCLVFQQAVVLQVCRNSWQCGPGRDLPCPCQEQQQCPRPLEQGAQSLSKATATAWGLVTLAWLGKLSGWHFVGHWGYGDMKCQTVIRKLPGTRAQGVALGRGARILQDVRAHHRTRTHGDIRTEHV